MSPKSVIRLNLGKYINFCVSCCVHRPKMETKNWFERVPVSEWCCGGSRGRTHCGLSADPLHGESGGQSDTGGPVGWLNPAAIFIQTCRAASLRDWKGRSIYRNSTSRRAWKQSHTTSKELLAKSPERHKHSLTTRREDREEAEIQLQNSCSSLWCDREKCHAGSESPHRTDQVRWCSASNLMPEASTAS